MPVYQVMGAFYGLYEHLRDEVGPLLDYFEYTFMGRPRRHGKIEVLFPVDSMEHQHQDQRRTTHYQQLSGIMLSGETLSPTTHICGVYSACSTVSISSNRSILHMSSVAMNIHPNGVFTSTATSESSAVYMALPTKTHWITCDVLPTICC